MTSTVLGERSTQSLQVDASGGGSHEKLYELQQQQGNRGTGRALTA